MILFSRCVIKVFSEKSSKEFIENTKRELERLITAKEEPKKHKKQLDILATWIMHEMLYEKNWFRKLGSARPVTIRIFLNGCMKYEQ